MRQPYFHLIMPFGSDRQAEKKQDIIRKVAATYGLEPHFPRYKKAGEIFDLNTSINDLNGSDFVLVDLSLERPSCYYELGLAEALRKKVYLIAKQGTDIHQTAHRNYVRFYSGLDHLETTIKELLGEATASPSLGQVPR